MFHLKLERLKYTACGSVLSYFETEFLSDVAIYFYLFIIIPFLYCLFYFIQGWCFCGVLFLPYCMIAKKTIKTIE